MAVAVYLRVSSKSQQVRSQRRAIERYLNANRMTNARWFVDEGVSGTVMERPALADLRQAVFLGEVDAVIVYSLDRLARSAVEGMKLLADWLKRGVRLVVITMQMDFSGEIGQMVAALLLHLGQMERTRIRERQAAGIAGQPASDGVAGARARAGRPTRSGWLNCGGEVSRTVRSPRPSGSRHEPSAGWQGAGRSCPPGPDTR